MTINAGCWERDVAEETLVAEQNSAATDDGGVGAFGKTNGDVGFFRDRPLQSTEHASGTNENDSAFVNVRNKFRRREFDCGFDVVDDCSNGFAQCFANLPVVHGYFFRKSG